MSASASVIRAMVPWDREHRPRLAALLAACAAVDAVAVGILLLGTPLPRPLEGLAAALTHGAAVLLMSGLDRARPGRRWLCIAAALAVPFVGAAVAGATSLTKGRGTTGLGRRRKTRRRPALTMAAMRRLGSALSPCDALIWGDEDQRRAALSRLSSREDPEAIALLRRAAAGHDPDLALSAALVLDEIRERAERKLGRPDPAEVRHGAG